MQAEKVRFSGEKLNTTANSRFMWDPGYEGRGMVALGLDKGWLRGEQSVIALLWLLPAYELFNRVFSLPQIGPAILLLMLLIIVRRVRLTGDERDERAALIYSHAIQTIR